MSERRELVERAVQAVNERDRVALGTIVDPDLEFVSLFSALEGGAVYRGVDGIDDLFTALDEAWENLTWHLDSVRDSQDMTVVSVRMVGTARSSGVPLDQPAAMVWTWRGGKVLRSQTYLDLEEALEAAGLSE